MTRARLAAMAVAVIIAAAVVLLVRFDLRGGAPTIPSNAGTSREVAALPTSTPTPPPWQGSVLAAAVQFSAGQVGLGGQVGPADREGQAGRAGEVASTGEVTQTGQAGPAGQVGQAVALHEVGGDGPARLLVSGFDELGHLAWSPDGSKLAFAGLRDRNWDIYEILRDGTGLQRLTEHAAYDAWPTWSPDGRQIAFSSYRDGDLDLYRMATGDAGSGLVERLTETDGPSIEPAWSPDGEWIIYSAWNTGAYRLEAVTASGDDWRVVADTDGDADLRSPAWTSDGERIVRLERRHGPGQVVARPWIGDGSSAGSARRLPSARTLAVEVDAFLLYPDGDALATVSDQRSARSVDIREGIGVGRSRIAMLPDGAGDVSWTRGPMPFGLAEMRTDAAGPVSAAGSAGSGAAPETLSGLVALTDVRVPGARINAGLANDFAAMRAEVRAGTGADFLGTLADLWRPLGYDGSAFFSWHKTGRAFDTQMEFRGPDGRRGMVLVRDDAGGRTMWRMFLRAGAQDGSVGRPLVEPGWAFAAGSGDPELTAEGGKRGSSVPDGYWFDFTATAERYGWNRIPSITRGDLNWRRNWTGIDFWHYERRDGLRWFEAARQVYTDEELNAELRAERLRERGITFGRLSRLGFPTDWFSGG